MKTKPFILKGKCEYGDFTISVVRGDGQYIKHEATASCFVFGKEYKETVYDDDINVVTRKAGETLIKKLKSEFGI